MYVYSAIYIYNYKYIYIYICIILSSSWSFCRAVIMNGCGCFGLARGEAKKPMYDYSESIIFTKHILQYKVIYIKGQKLFGR